MSTKIISLELENVKRVAIVKLEPAQSGLTVIGGDNAQGKTSILDAICYALGGKQYRPTNLEREGAIGTPKIELKLSNGLLVERKGKNSDLKVTDPSGRKSGQGLLDSFIEELALNLPKFLEMKPEEQAIMLLKTLGIGEVLEEIDRREESAYNKRQAFFGQVDQKLKYANELPEYPDAPDCVASVADLVKEAGEISAHNGAIASAKAHITMFEAEKSGAVERIEKLKQEMEFLQGKIANIDTSIDTERKLSEETPISTEEIEARIRNIEVDNDKVRANENKAKALSDAEELAFQYNEMSNIIESIRDERRKLLETAEMPLAEISIMKNSKNRPVITYKGQPWDGMSSMEQIKVATAIVRKLKPDCGFILLDGLECFDLEQLKLLNEWLMAEDLQAIATRVSRGDECSVIIENGVAVQGGKREAW